MPEKIATAKKKKNRISSEKFGMKGQNYKSKKSKVKTKIQGNQKNQNIEKKLFRISRKNWHSRIFLLASDKNSKSQKLNSIRQERFFLLRKKFRMSGNKLQSTKKKSKYQKNGVWKNVWKKITYRKITKKMKEKVKNLYTFFSIYLIFAYPGWQHEGRSAKKSVWEPP